MMFLWLLDIDVTLDTGRLLAAADATACVYEERSRIEALDAAGAVTASELHVTQVEVTPRAQKRTLLEIKKEKGELDAKLRPKQEQRTLRTPFHPQERDKYRFTWLTPRSEPRASVRFEPLDPSVERPEGVAVLDTRTGALISMRSRPSKLPAFVNLLESDASFGMTPCGLRALRFELTGDGGALFLRTRFHSVSSMTGHAKKDTPQ